MVSLEAFENDCGEAAIDANLEVRASDAEREAVITALRQHTDAGRLTLEEFLERLDEAYASKTRLQLDHVLRELPRLPAAATEAPARRRVRMPQPLIAYLVFAVGMIGLWALGDRGYFWPVWPLMGWGIPLLGKLTGHGCRGRQTSKIC